DVAQSAMRSFEPVTVGDDTVAAHPKAQEALAAQRSDVEMITEDRDARGRPRVTPGLDEWVHEARITGLAVDLGPAVVLARLDEIDLVVATRKSRRPVLRRDQAAAAVPGQALRISMAERPHRRPLKRIVRRHAAVGVDPEDLPGEQIAPLRELVLPGVTHRDV